MRIPYVTLPVAAGLAIDMPMLPLRLAYGNSFVDVDALVDSGAMLSVIPYDLGVRLGLDWSKCTIDLSIGGAVGGMAKAVMLDVTIGSFPTTPLVFAWSNSPNVRVILGQRNFFAEFDVCFYGSQSYFEVKPKP
jgi:hypothetical protein